MTMPSKLAETIKAITYEWAYSDRRCLEAIDAALVPIRERIERAESKMKDFTKQPGRYIPEMTIHSMLIDLSEALAMLETKEGE